MLVVVVLVFFFLEARRRPTVNVLLFVNDIHEESDRGGEYNTQKLFHPNPNTGNIEWFKRTLV